MGKKNRQSTGTKEFDALLKTLRDAREKSGLSQREVARQLGFHPTIYGKVERGERILDIVEFVRLADVLGRDAPDLMSDYAINLREFDG